MQHLHQQPQVQGEHFSRRTPVQTPLLVPRRDPRRHTCKPCSSRAANLTRRCPQVCRWVSAPCTVYSLLVLPRDFVLLTVVYQCSSFGRWHTCLSSIFLNTCLHSCLKHVLDLSSRDSKPKFSCQSFFYCATRCGWIVGSLTCLICTLTIFLVSFSAEPSCEVFLEELLAQVNGVLGSDPAKKVPTHFGKFAYLVPHCIPRALYHCSLCVWRVCVGVRYTYLSRLCACVCTRTHVCVSLCGMTVLRSVHVAT